MKKTFAVVILCLMIMILFLSFGGGVRDCTDFTYSSTVTIYHGFYAGNTGIVISKSAPGYLNIQVGDPRGTRSIKCSDMIK